MSCIHVFIGSTDGVCCQKCGKKLTANEYKTYLNKANKKETAAKKEIKK